MKKIVLLLVFTFSVLVAKVDYSEMSNQELLALMGYVAPKNQALFEKELSTRVPTFSPQERGTYQKNLPLLQKQKKK